MHLLLALLLLQAKNADEAYAQFQKGRKSLDEGRYEEAARAFQECIKNWPTEGGLRFRKLGAMVEEPDYHPEFFAGLSLMRHAEQASTPQEKRDRFVRAKNHLSRSVRPAAGNLESAADLTKKVTASIDGIERALAAPPPAANPPPQDPFVLQFPALQGRVQVLSAAEDFDAALAELKAKEALFKGREKEKAELEGMIVRLREEAVKKRETEVDRMLDLMLQNPLQDPDGQLRRLEAARLPSKVQKEPPPKFAWYDRFLADYKDQSGKLSNAGQLDVKDLNAVAERFETLAREAFQAGYFQGFQSSREVAQAARQARLQTLKDSSDPEPVRLLEAGLEDGQKKSRELLAKAAAEAKDPQVRAAAERYLKEGFDRQREPLQAALGNIESRVGTGKIVEEALRELDDAAVAMDASRLKGIATRVGRMEARLATVQNVQRGQAYFAAAIAQASAGLLEGEERRLILETVRQHVALAWKCDGEVAAPWKGRVSPKVLALLDEARN